MTALFVGLHKGSTRASGNANRTPGAQMNNDLPTTATAVSDPETSESQQHECQEVVKTPLVWAPIGKNSLVRKIDFRNVTLLIQMVAIVEQNFPFTPFAPAHTLVAHIVLNFLRQFSSRLIAATMAIHAELSKGKASIFFRKGIASGPKAAASFDKLALKGKRELLINDSGVVFSNFCFDAFQTEFTELGIAGVNREEVDALLKGISMRYCVDKAVDSEKIYAHAKKWRHDDLLCDLFSICVEARL